MKVYFIGAGPGDPELITVKGKKIIAEAGVIIYAGSLVNPEILDYAGEEAEIYNSARMEREEIISVMVRAVKEGKPVARVHTGDPAIYGAIQEQMDNLQEAEIDYEIIPGVSSFLAAAAALEREFTLPDVSQTVIITRLEGRTPVPEKESLEKLAVHRASMAIFLSVQMIDKVVERLRQGYEPQTPVAVVARASWPDERIIRGNLQNIATRVKEAGIKKTALILVGDFIDTEYRPSRLYDKKFSHDYRQAKEEKKAILVTSFGTSYRETAKLTIKACEREIEASFPAYEVRRAYTSGMIRRKLKKRDGIEINSPAEALQQLKEEGFSEVTIQPLHIIPGSEYHDLVQVAGDYRHYFRKLIMGEPLLYDQADYLQLIEALKSQLPDLEDGEAVILMGHGSKHPANTAYPTLDYVLKDSGHHQIHVGTVEGYPQLETVTKHLHSGIEKVHLHPLMLVAGDHARNDMAGPERDSWQSVLKAAGYEVETYLHGLGENELIRKLYVNKVKYALQKKGSN